MLQDQPLFIEILHNARQAISIRYLQLALASSSIISQMPDMSLWASHMAAIKANVFEGPCAKRSCWNPGEGCSVNRGRQEPHSLYSWWWDKVSGKLRSIAWCPRRATLHELPSVSHSLLKLSENGCFTFFSCPESDAQRWPQCLLKTPVPQIPDSSGP